MNARTLDLQQAADHLGVHYQTAYRWVRSGRLPAVLVDGRYELEPAEVAAFDAQRKRPSQPRPRRPRQGFGQMSERAHTFLVDGAEAEMRRLAQTLVEQGVSVTTVVDDVLAPALRRIGEDWHAGGLPIWTEHRATAIVERLLGEHHPSPRGRRRGTAVVAAVSGDLHALPTSMAATALREDNWRVHHLGADVPSADLVDFCTRAEADLLVLSVANQSLRSEAEAVAADLKGRVPTLVGAAGSTLKDLVRQAREVRSW